MTGRITQRGWWEGERTLNTRVCQSEKREGKKISRSNCGNENFSRVWFACKVWFSIFLPSKGEFDDWHQKKGEKVVACVPVVRRALLLLSLTFLAFTSRSRQTRDSLHVKAQKTNIWKRLLNLNWVVDCYQAVNKWGTHTFSFNADRGRWGCKARCMCLDNQNSEFGVTGGKVKSTPPSTCEHS